MDWKEILKTQFNPVIRRASEGQPIMGQGAKKVEEWAQGQICPEGQKWCKECRQCEPLDKWREHKRNSVFEQEAAESQPEGEECDAYRCSRRAAMWNPLAAEQLCQYHFNERKSRRVGPEGRRIPMHYWKPIKEKKDMTLRRRG